MVIATGTPSAPQHGPGSEEDRKQHLTWFYFQRPTVDLNVEPLGGGAAEVLEHAVDGLGDIIRHRLVQLHPAVDHHTAVPEVEDFQLLEPGQIGLQIWQKLQESDNKSGSIFPRHFDRFFSNVLKKTGGGAERLSLWGHEVSTWAIRLTKCCWCQSDRPESSRRV